MSNLIKNFKAAIYPSDGPDAVELQSRHSKAELKELDVFHQKSTRRWWIPPIFYWLQGYNFHSLFMDVLCGVTIGFMVIPQGISDASIIGIPAEYGLYASFLAVIPYVFFGTSPHVAMGPSAIISILVNTAIKQQLKTGYPKKLTKIVDQKSQIKHLCQRTQQLYVLQMVFLIAFFSGIFTFSIGFFRLGYLVNLISKTVFNGFTSAAGIIIITQQFKNFFGMHHKFNEAYEWENLRHFFRYIHEVHGPTTGFAILFCCILMTMTFIGKRWPRLKYVRFFGPFFVLCLGIIISYAGRLYPHYNIAIIDVIPKGMPAGINPFYHVPGCLNQSNFHAKKGENVTYADLAATCEGKNVPDIDYAVVLQTAILCCLVGYLETIAIGGSMSIKFNYRIDPNMEAISMGLANLMCSFFRGFPVNGSLSRTSVAAAVGGKTPLNNILVFLLIMIVVNALTNIFEYIPYFCLAAIICNAAARLISIRKAIALFKVSKVEFSLFFFTFIACLLVGIEIGIALAVLLSILRILAESAFPKITILGQVPDTPSTFKSIEKFHDLIIFDYLQILRIDSPIYFVNISYLKNAIHAMLLRYNGDPTYRPPTMLGANFFFPKINILTRAQTEGSLPDVIDQESRQQQEQHASNAVATDDVFVGGGNSNRASIDGGDKSAALAARRQHLKHRLHFLIFDFSPVTSLDVQGANGLSEIFDECAGKGVALYFCNIQDQVVDLIKSSGYGEKFFRNDSNFHTTLEALNRCKGELLAKENGATAV